MWGQSVRSRQKSGWRLLLSMFAWLPKVRSWKAVWRLTPPKLQACLAVTPKGMDICQGKGTWVTQIPVLWISSFAIQDLCLSKFSQGHGQLNETVGRKTPNCFSFGCGNSEVQTVPNWKRLLPLPNPSPHSQDGRNKESTASCLLTEGQPEVGPTVLPPTRGSLSAWTLQWLVCCVQRGTHLHTTLILLRSLPAPDVCSGASAPRLLLLKTGLKEFILRLWGRKKLFAPQWPGTVVIYLTKGNR